MTMISVVREIERCKVVDGSGDIDIVVAIPKPGFSRQAEPGYEVLKITIIFILPGFLVNSTA